MDTIQRYRTIIIWTMIGAITLGIFWYAFTLAQRVGKVAFTLTVVPPDAKVKMNDVTVSSGTYYLLPGKYTVVAQADGFTNYRKVVQIDQSQDNSLAVPLVPISDKAKQWVDNNKQLYQGVVDTNQTVAQQTTDLLKKKNPITDLLPFRNLLFLIDYRADPTDVTNSRIILQITAGESYKRSALKQLRDWGYDPTDYKIEFVNYTNPFAA